MSGGKFVGSRDQNTDIAKGGALFSGPHSPQQRLRKSTDLESGQTHLGSDAGPTTCQLHVLGGVTQSLLRAFAYLCDGVSLHFLGVAGRTGDERGSWRGVWNPASTW